MDFKEKLTGVQKERFCTVANKLLNECYLVKPKKKSNLDYTFVMENKDVFTEYFDFLGYDLNIDSMNGVIGISNRNGTGRLRLRKIESILLLILRLIYIEKRKDISLSDEVVVEIGYIIEKFTLLGFKKKVLDKNTIQNTIALFKRYNLIDIYEDRDYKDEIRIAIQPSVMMLLTYDSLENAYRDAQEKLKEYRNKGNVEEVYEETDESKAS